MPGDIPLIPLSGKPVSPELFAKLATLLSQAFATDPFYAYIMPDESRRHSQLMWWMSAFLRAGLRYGEVCSLGEDPMGVAIWLTPRAPRPHSFHMARLGLGLAPFKLGLKPFGRMMAITGDWQRHHALEPKQHWYLNMLGVDPRYQGRGHGSRLIREVLPRADSQRLTCYLETTTESNVRLYQRHGFEVATQKGIEGGKAPWTAWTMRRNPVSS